MALIYLIRHGQASAQAADYDQLSELGYTQCGYLGDFLSKQNISPTKVYYGPRKRHRQTYESARKEHWPTAQMLPELDEYPAHEMLEFGMEKMLELEPTLSNDIELIQSSTGSAGPAYVSLLKYASIHWMTGNLIHPQIESYSQYRKRLIALSELLLKSNEDECILLFSSAGFISTFLSFIVDGSPEKSFNTAWSLYNATVNILHVKEEIRISTVNQIHFLPEQLRSFV